MLKGCIFRIRVEQGLNLKVQGLGLRGQGSWIELYMELCTSSFERFRGLNTAFGLCCLVL